MSDQDEFQRQRKQNISQLREDAALREHAAEFTVKSARNHYTYNFDFLGLPIIQFPQDIVCLQELVWKTKPDLVVETGIARGGSLILFAAMLHLLGGERRVIGVDIDVRPHNRRNIVSHPFGENIDLIEGSSVNQSVINAVSKRARAADRVMVILDSNHTHDHVLAELRAYGPMVSQGCYLVVFDTVIEDVPETLFADRSWGHGNNPKTAVRAYLEETDRFEVDADIDARLAISSAPGGYLKCVAPRAQE